MALSNRFDRYAVSTPVRNGNFQQCGNSTYYSREEAEWIYQMCGEHIPVIMRGYTDNGAWYEVKRNYQ